MKRILLLFNLFFAGITQAQDLTVPTEILEELKTVTLTTNQDTFAFRVAYPDNYDPSQQYAGFIGLSGGNQTIKEVDYCYAAYFRSGYFNNHMTILPVVGKDTIQFQHYSDERIQALTAAIEKHFQLKPGWLIAGTSNGGEAAFRFIAENPERYNGLIVVPGALPKTITITERWKHMKAIVAYGTADAKTWKKEAKFAVKSLAPFLKSVQLVKLKDQGHILPISFNADKFYDPYFLSE